MGDGWMGRREGEERTLVMARKLDEKEEEIIRENGNETRESENEGE